MVLFISYMSIGYMYFENNLSLSTASILNLKIVDPAIHDDFSVWFRENWHREKTSALRLLDCW